jgi:retron-type reverse transcriptase
MNDNTKKLTVENIISVENLLLAWREFVCGKKDRKDVMEFSLCLSENIFDLHYSLKSKTYTHGGYHAFKISDPKPRDIHKASVRDRLSHHAIYRVLCPHFDRKFIFDSYSCRDGKGTHKAIDRLNLFARKVSKNNTKQCWILKCDIKKFFASVDQKTLIEILDRQIEDKNIVWLVRKVVESFHSTGVGKGLPLGNLTSQLLVNIYMNEFDQFVKHSLKIKYYVRYADDFVFLSQDRRELENILPKLREFLENKLKLNLHPDKVIIQTFSSGTDFLGWVNFTNHRILRTATKRRMLKNLRNNPKPEIIQSYSGLLSHGNTYNLRNKILSVI